MAANDRRADRPAAGRRGRRVARWGELLDRAERLIARTDADAAEIQRRASILLDELFAFEHTLTPDERRAARERVWLRDHPDPLPDEGARRDWERCRCRACAIEGGLGRASTDPEAQRALRLVPVPIDSPHEAASQEAIVTLSIQPEGVTVP